MLEVFSTLQWQSPGSFKAWTSWSRRPLSILSHYEHITRPFCLSISLIVECQLWLRSAQWHLHDRALHGIEQHQHRHSRVSIHPDRVQPALVELLHPIDRSKMKSDVTTYSSAELSALLIRNEQMQFPLSYTVSVHSKDTTRSARIEKLLPAVYFECQRKSIPFHEQSRFLHNVPSRFVCLM